MPAIATIATKVNGNLLDVPHANFVAGQTLQIYPPNKPRSANQTWTIVSSSDGVPVPHGYVNIFCGDELSSHLLLDVPHANTTPGTLVQLYPANQPGGTPNQQWKYISAGNNYVYIASALNENLVLDLRGGGAAPGTPLQIWELGHLQPNQMWILNPA
jgi:hypothetical protein